MEKLYADLRPMDVKYTVDHDAWKRWIDMDSSRNAYDFEAKAKEIAVGDIKTWIANAFKKHKEAYYKKLLDDVNERYELSKKMWAQRAENAWLKRQADQSAKTVEESKMMESIQEREDSWIMGIPTANLLTKKTYDEMKEVIRETTEARFGAVVEAIQKSYEMQGYKFTNDGNQLERIYKEAVGDKYRK